MESNKQHETRRCRAGRTRRTCGGRQGARSADCRSRNRRD